MATFLGYPGNATLTGDASDDLFAVLGGWTGTVSLSGGGGNDVFYFSSDFITTAGLFSTIDVGTGADAVYSYTASGPVSIVANADAIGDTFIVGIGADTILAGGGNDYIVSTGGADNITAGGGDDTISIQAGAATVFAGTGNDTVTGGDGAETIDGGSGSNWIVAGGGNDLIFSSGTDIIFGGGGTDTLSFANLAAGVVVNTFSATSAAITGTTYFDSIEKFVGTSAADTFTMVAGTIDGGGGFDTLDLRDFQIGFSIDLSTADSPAFDLRLISIEGIVTGYGADVLTGNGLANLLDGGANGDEISGGGGNDTIIGGAGDDLLTGGTGADVFKFAADFGADIIFDFEVGVDKLSFATGSVTAANFTLDGSELTFTSGSSSILFLADASGFNFANDVIFY
jgi:Ca2+-binding RTX toxin-like protein